MTLADLIATARARSDDRVEPYLNSDADLTQWANEAEAEACMRAWLLYDRTSAFCEIPLVADQVDYPLDPRILRIDTAVFQSSSGGRERALELTGVDDMPAGHSAGRVCRAAHMKYDLRVWPAPTAYALGTIRMAVYRLPLQPMAALTDEPEILPEHHAGLVDWMLFRAFGFHDNDTFDPRHAADALALFERNFGTKNTADVMRRHRERRRVTAPYGGIL